MHSKQSDKAVTCHGLIWNARFSEIRGKSNAATLLVLVGFRHRVGYPAMKVYISVDIEGITGLVSWSHCSRPDGSSYDFPYARRMMSHDLNAAIRGVRAAGATEVVIKDSHGNSKNLLIEDLEPGVELISGHGAGRDGMMEGIDASFDAALLVGYHARAGTQAGIMEHTITGGEHRIWVNGAECGEIGLSLGVASRYGVPLVMISSDEAGCDEASVLVSGIATAPVKKGFGRYMGKLLHPSVTGPMIENAAADGVRRASAIGTRPFAEPTSVRVEFNRAESADMASKLLPVSRVDAYTVESTQPNYADAHTVVWNIMAMMQPGISTMN